MVVLAREKARPARGAQRVDDERIARAQTFPRQPIHVRRLEPRESAFLTLLVLHDAHRVGALIVGDDEEEVGTIRGGGVEEWSEQRGGAGTEKSEKVSSLHCKALPAQCSRC